MSFDDDFFDAMMFEDVTGGFDEEDALSDRYDPEAFIDDEDEFLNDDEYEMSNDDEEYILYDAHSNSSDECQIVNLAPGDDRGWFYEACWADQHLTPEQLDFRRKHYINYFTPNFKSFIRTNFPEIKLSKTNSEIDLDDAFFIKYIQKEPQLAFDVWKALLKEYPPELLLEEAWSIGDNLLEKAIIFQPEMTIDELNNDKCFFTGIITNYKSYISSGRIELLWKLIEYKDYHLFMKIYDITKEQFDDEIVKQFQFGDDFSKFLMNFIDNACLYTVDLEGVEFLKKIRDEQTDEELVELFNNKIDDLIDDFTSDDEKCLTKEQVEFRHKYFNDQGDPKVREFVKENYPQVKISKGDYYRDFDGAFFFKYMKKEPEFAFELWKDILKNFPVDMLLRDSYSIVDPFMESASSLQPKRFIEELKTDKWFFDELITNIKSPLSYGRLELLGATLETKDYKFFMQLYEITKKQFIDLKDTAFDDGNFETFDIFIQEFLDRFNWRFEGIDGIELLEKMRNDFDDEEMQETINDYIDEIKENEEEDDEDDEEVEEYIEPFNVQVNKLLDMLIEGTPYKSSVAGTTFLKDKSVLDEINEGDSLSFERETNNQYDSNAVLILFNGRKLGYIPQLDSANISRLLSSNKNLIGKIVRIYKTSEYCNIRIEINIATSS